MPKGYRADGTPVAQIYSYPGLQKLVAEGWRLRELAEKYGASRQGILSEIRRRGIYYPWNKGSPGSRNGSWKGGISKQRQRGRDGYWIVQEPNHPHARRGGWMLEHRLVMEEKLGRYLLPQEVVHHIDGNIDNNHQDNLALYSSNADHLADTLNGKVPKWTKKGFQRMQEGGRYVRTAETRKKISAERREWWRRQKRLTNLAGSKNDAEQ